MGGKQRRGRTTTVREACWGICLSQQLHRASQRSPEDVSGAPSWFPSLMTKFFQGLAGLMQPYVRMSPVTALSHPENTTVNGGLNQTSQQVDMTFTDILYCNSSMKFFRKDPFSLPFHAPSSISTQWWLEFQKALSLVSGETQHLQRSELLVWRNAH